MQFSLTLREHELIRDYVMLMLGAPVVKVELDEKQLKIVIDHLEQIIAARVNLYSFDKISVVFDDIRPVLLLFVQEGALIQAKEILGRIRGKYNNVPSPVSDHQQLDGRFLLEEYAREWNDWKEEFKNFWLHWFGE